MDSTPIPISNPNPNPNSNSNPNPPLSIKASARKLPIKRKAPLPHPNPNLTPKREHVTTTARGDGDGAAAAAHSKAPPFKFHRIWTETDEVRFLLGLLESSNEGLSFPRDLHVFYTRFSGTMTQPYSKSQLSEKLRRLRKKFRLISSRLARGLDVAHLSSHDRALYELSKKLWHPEYFSVSPFGDSNCGGGNKKSKPVNNLVGVKVSFSPTIPLASDTTQNHAQSLNENNSSIYSDNDNYDDGCRSRGGSGGGGGGCSDGSGGGNGNVNVSDVNFDNDGCVDVNVSELNLDADHGVREELCFPGRSDGGLGRVAAKAVIDVLDQSLKEARMVLVRQGLLYPDHETTSDISSKREKAFDFERRWREQQVAELDVLAGRLRLVLENALQGQ
ncbi:probable transcription factor At3g04930 [Malania oleifera]|uniref:probable transcription factor At3g04930 n=1 Tax=Malania oleifera TaxID=397392 RepID=UPI0025AECD54|nr:probable transcription factor At3g04930 [Malania oleifera]